MTALLLINPNSSQATTRMMVAIAQAEAGDRAGIRGVTARRGPPMIVTPDALAASAAEVVALGLEAEADGIIVGAFGDPGLDELKRRAAVPVVGICEAAMREAAEGGRRFGVATTTPELAAAIDAKGAAFAPLYTGIRLTTGDPFALVADPQALAEALATATAACFADGAEAVIIGGGPLGQAAVTLEKRFARPVIGPIPAAVRRLLRLLRAAPAASSAPSAPPPP